MVMAVLALGAAVAVHHDGMAIGGMADHHGMSVALEICLGVITAVGTVAIAGVLGVLSRRRAHTSSVLMSAGPLPRVRPPVPRARAGPPLLCLLCVSRR